MSGRLEGRVVSGAWGVRCGIWCGGHVEAVDWDDEVAVAITVCRRRCAV